MFPLTRSPFDPDEISPQQMEEVRRSLRGIEPVENRWLAVPMPNTEKVVYVIGDGNRWFVSDKNRKRGTPI